jgi:Lrp/AsnC family leucine-responsive transcriptional regulator
LYPFFFFHLTPNYVQRNIRNILPDFTHIPILLYTFYALSETLKYLQKIKDSEKIELDVKDKKILAILSQNSRLPLTQLSKKVGLSRDAVKYRISNYESKGIIQGYRTIVDITKFKYKANHLLIKLNNPNQKIEAEVIEKLINSPYIRAIIKYSGSYDFQIAFVTTDIPDLDEKITKIISDFSGLVQDYEVLTISKTFVAETFPPNFFNPNVKNVLSKKPDIKIDDKDIEILKLISEDAKLELHSISSKLKLSTDAVSYRIKNMISSGVILKFVPVINYTSLDYSLYTILLNINSLDESKEKILRNFLIQDKNTLWAVKTIGRFNVLIYLLVKNIQELQDTVLSLRSLFPNQINHYETLIAYEEYKYTYFPEDLF